MKSELAAAELIRSIPDFPEKGVLFRDITPILADADAFEEVINAMVDHALTIDFDLVVGIESRGFILGSPIAVQLARGFVPVRKIGKLPHDTVQSEYELEYGNSIVEMHKDAIIPGQKVLVVDDLLATGGTAQASVDLIKQLGGRVAGLVFLIELKALKGRERLEGLPVKSFVTY